MEKRKTPSQKKIAKLNRQLLSKINNILDEYNTQDKLIPYELSNDIRYEIKPNPNEEPQQSFPILPNIENNNISPNPQNIIKNKEKEKTQKNIKNKSKKKKVKKTDTPFFTDIYSIKNKKIDNKKKEDEEIIKFREQNNKRIDELINTIDSIPSYSRNTKKNDSVYNNDKDIVEMINYIDGYTNEIHETFDEVKFLIKMSKNTHKLIDRHKNVLSNIFNKAGMRPKGIQEYDNEDNNNKNKINNQNNQFKKEYNNIYYNRRRRDENDMTEVFDRLQKINKIKENISNTQDGFLGYHQSLQKKLKEDEKY